MREITDFVYGCNYATWFISPSYEMPLISQSEINTIIYMTEKSATFENMPHMIATLLHEVVELREHIHQLVRPTEDKPGMQWLNVDELREFLPSHPKKQTIYSWTSKRMIPFHKKGRSIMFDKAEIEAWLQESDYMKSVEEIGREAEDFIHEKRISKRF